MPPLILDQFVKVKGQFRSRDIDVDGKLKVELYVYAQEIYNINIEEENKEKYENVVSIEGFICKRPVIRTTPSGKQVTDLLVACNFGKDKTAYIPCIAWGK